MYVPSFMDLPGSEKFLRSWLSETQWAQLKTLENMEAFKKGGQLTQNIEQDTGTNGRSRNPGRDLVT